MVNLEKWVEIPYAEIKPGDKLKVVQIMDDGLKIDRTGRSYRKSITGEMWFTSGDWTLVNSRDLRTTIYRRKPDSGKLPKRHGAVLKAVPRDDTNPVYLVLGDHDSVYSWWSEHKSEWHSEEEIKSEYHSIEVLSKGTKIA